MSSIFGHNIKISVFGQSHSDAIGVTVDGLPAGEVIDPAALRAFMARRAPGQGAYSTTRREPDLPEFLSGVLEGENGMLVTCGAPLTAIIRNTNTRSSDYAKLKDCPRPGHADYTAEVRYNGYQDVRGGGHFSGRLTAPLCIAGGICLQILARRGITVGAHIYSVGDVQDTPYSPLIDTPALLQKTASGFPVLDDEAGKAMLDLIEVCRKDGDSIGGIIECAVIGVPAGIGSPMFDGVENRLAQAIFGIPAVKGVEFGAGFDASRLRGSQNNDGYYMDGSAVKTRTNRAGGILGGITNGMPVLFRAAFKPTPSIFREQQSVSLSGGCDTPLVIEGRHDPCIVPRAVPVVEAVAAAVMLDMILDS
ncbi:MAG: chorismate synthase [Clostridia bacterium]|nr:chorismate synthase [Clostridia bacterium]